MIGFCLYWAERIMQRPAICFYLITGIMWFWYCCCENNTGICTMYLFFISMCCFVSLDAKRKMLGLVICIYLFTGIWCFWFMSNLFLCGVLAITSHQGAVQSAFPKPCSTYWLSIICCCCSCNSFREYPCHNKYLFLCLSLLEMTVKVVIEQR